VAINPIINPNSLKIEGWFALNHFEKGEYILPAREIRDFIAKGLVVDDHDSLTHPDDMVRLKDVINIRFELIGKSVITESKNRLGKVADYAVDETSYLINKLYVNPTLLKGFTAEQLLIDRNQIVEITDKKIIVKDQKVRANSRMPARAEA
jgi:sporulation protein YlmC with PRC-barrel domain